MPESDGKPHADVAELADALDSGSSARKGVEVRILSSALSPDHSVSANAVKENSSCFPAVWALAGASLGHQ